MQCPPIEENNRFGDDNYGDLNNSEMKCLGEAKGEGSALAVPIKGK